MKEINIEGIILTHLQKIHHSKGHIFHGMKKSDRGFASFGEVYFSTINSGEVKGWNRHKKMTLNLIVPVGEVSFVIFDCRENSVTEGNYCEVTLSPNNYQRLTVPPGLWLAFKGSTYDTNLILNVSDMEHDPDEIERLEIDKIDYNWDST